VGRRDEIEVVVAKMLAAGKIVAWLQDRTERASGVPLAGRSLQASRRFCATGLKGPAPGNDILRRPGAPA
jgi:hypothetical protein